MDKNISTNTNKNVGFTMLLDRKYVSMQKT